MKKHELNIPVRNKLHKGTLVLPENYSGFVIFSHGSDSNRLSPQDNTVAEILNEKRFATLLFDMLSVDESWNTENRFNIPLFSETLLEVTLWVKKNYDTSKGLSYFGSDNGAAFAFYAASKLEEDIIAIVSRVGRPDLALPILKSISIPTLLLVGEADIQVLELNKTAYEELGGKKKLQIITGATHLFEQPGKLEEVAESAAKWYRKYTLKTSSKIS